MSKTCLNCASAFEAKRNTAKYCQACKKKVKLQQAKAKGPRTEYMAKYREKNRDKRNQWQQDWRAANPDQYKHLQAMAEQRRRNRKRATDSESYDRLEVFESNKWVCHICVQQINSELRRPDPMAGTIDHLWSISAGGKDIRSNVAPAHNRCNSVKNSKSKIIFGDTVSLKGGFNVNGK